MSTLHLNTERWDGSKAHEISMKYKKSYNELAYCCWIYISTRLRVLLLGFLCCLVNTYYIMSAKLCDKTRRRYLYSQC